jgi:hypothetical protein
MRQSKRLVGISIAIAVAVWPAIGSGETVAVLVTKAPLRARMTRLLKQQGIKVVPATQVGRVFRGESAPTSDADWARLAGKLSLDAFVIAKPASEGGARAQFDLIVRNGNDGAIASQETVSARARPKQMGALIAAALSKRSTVPADKPSAIATEHPVEDPLSMGGARVPELGKVPVATTVASAEGSPAPVAATEPPALDAAKSSGPGGDAHRARQSSRDSDTTLMAEGGAGGGRFDGAVGQLATFDIEAEVRELRRTFDYSGGGGGPRYRLTFNPVAGARASYFPIHHAGLFAAGEFGAGLETSGFPTGTRELMGGVQGRLPLAFGQVRASAAYFHHAFLVQDTSSTSDASRLTLGVPNTVYAGARFSVSAQLALTSRVRLGVEAAYRLVTTVGSDAAEVRSAAYFPGSSAPYGLDGRAVVSVALTRMFEARAGFDYRRYGYGSLQGTTAAGTIINASSATDQYMAFSLGVAAVLGPQ